MNEYAVCDPNDVRNLQGKRYAMKRIGAAVVRPATEAERAQFAPLLPAPERRQAMAQLMAGIGKAKT